MQRLSKVLQQSGAASRRGAEELIFEGKVKVNGVVILKPEHRVLPQDSITLNGKKIGKTQQKLYFVLNKPTGYLCSNERLGKERLVIDLFDSIKERLYTVGRLDKDTSGLLIVTNDGTFANTVMHPRYGVEKEYLVKADREVSQDHLFKISKGTYVEGIHVQPKRVQKVRRGTLKIIVGEGKKREVRHLVEDAGLQVVELKRIRIGDVRLGTLPSGMWRAMTEKEKGLLSSHD
jgi:23S rRNA pseudouridine2605 synthase